MIKDKEINDKRFDEILNQILKYSSGDFNFRGEVTSQGDKYDAVIAGLNMLGEEVQHMVSELENANQKARENERLKSAFLNNISHEIRTPVSIIIGFIDILKETEMATDENKLYLETISENANKLLYIINDIIDISCLELKTEKINETEVRIFDFISNLIKEFKFNQQQGKLSYIKLYLNKECDKDLHISTDKIKLGQILNKLIDNAIKYTIEGEVEVTYKIQNEYIQIDVRDTGIGIEKEKQGSIFEQFRQGEEKLTKKYGGVGLGLSISKSLVELLGGKIWLQSNPGKGSVFSFTIPYKTATSGSGEQDSYIMKNISFNNIFSGKTILIAENELNNFIILKKYLQATNATIVHACTGTKALELCKNPDIDIVLINTQLPEINGIETAAMIKKIRPDLPIISHASNHFPENRKESLKAGCVDYLPIPVHRKVLLNKLNKHLFKEKIITT